MADSPGVPGTEADARADPHTAEAGAATQADAEPHAHPDPASTTASAPGTGATA
ncbi:hypothetical protein [Streptomyces sp. NPDC005486]|uniref:hypothetical protein n=1 Tax=Streptomyces sp. NPDC005486 TaxID=3155345 RepID=UPI0033AF9AC5